MMKLDLRRPEETLMNSGINVLINKGKKKQRQKKRGEIRLEEGIVYWRRNNMESRTNQKK